MCPIHHRGKDSRRAEERLRLITARLKVFVWDSRRETSAIGGFGFVGDISDSGVGIYLGEPLAEGTSVRLSFESEDGTNFRGTVTGSLRYGYEQHFHGQEMLPFRVGIRCLFGSEAERQRYLEFQRQLRERALVTLPKA